MLRCKDKVVVVAGQLTLGTLKVLVESSAGGVYPLPVAPLISRFAERYPSFPGAQYTLFMSQFSVWKLNILRLSTPPGPPTRSFHRFCTVSYFL